MPCSFSPGGICKHFRCRRPILQKGREADGGGLVGSVCLFPADLLEAHLGGDWREYELVFFVNGDCSNSQMEDVKLPNPMLNGDKNHHEKDV